MQQKRLTPNCMRLNHEQVNDRWQKAHEARQDEMNKFDLIYSAKYAYEKHLELGDVWDESYRLPELFGITERKFTNLIEVLPEMRPRGEGDEVIALKGSYEHETRLSNIQREKHRAFRDAVDGGMGIVFLTTTRNEKKIKNPNGREKTELYYDGLAGERVDPRDFFPCHSSTVLHDHTGLNACPYVFRRKIFYVDSFRQKFDDPKYKNVNQIQGMALGGAFGRRTPTEKEALEQEFGDYVHVLEYWDQENDIFRIYANHMDEAHLIFDSPSGIPFNHKQLPFHVYYNYKREDSIAGIGEIELNMPYNLFREQVLNLMIDNTKLELQPAYIIDGDIQFNSEENELEPGALFTVRGLDGGKLQDHIQPFRTGGVTGDVFSTVQTLENSQIAVTGDDFRSLFANPGQLATQTLAKREALLKRIRGNVIRNTVESEWYFANQVIALLQEELAKPFKGADGKPSFRKIRIPGYQAVQDKEKSDVKFVEDEAAEGEFFLNPDVGQKFADIEIEVVPAKLDEELKRDQNEKLVLFMQQVLGVVQTNPQMAQEILGGMNIGHFLREVGNNFGLDVGKIFPTVSKSSSDVNPVSAEHEQIMMGIIPPTRPDEDSLEEYTKHKEFEKSATFQEIAKKNPKVKEAMFKHQLLTLENVQKTKANLLQTGQGGLESPQAPSEQGAVPGLPPIPTEQI